MMLLPIAVRCAAVLFAIAHGPSPAPPSRLAARRVAVTFDDLPVVSRAFTSAGDHARITRAIVAAIRAHHIPAIGFVNEGKIYRNGVADSAEIALLRQWSRAGLELGNHTWSHLDLHRVPVA